MVFHFDGRYRSALECKFLEQVEEDLTQFWSICRDDSVLVFPPLSACHRFLIHQLVGQSSKLQSVSLGQGRDRRTVVYFAPKRDPDKMAHSPSTSQKTFFGRGRGRRPRRPDQALYVPGALRKAKCDQLKENESTESAINSTESKSENRDISKGNKDSCNNAVPSTLFTSQDGHDDTTIPKSTVHESQTDECSSHSALSTSEKEDDSIIEGTEKTSLDTTVQDTNGPSHLFIDEQVWSENKKSNRENKKESDSDLVVTTSENLTSNDSVKEFDDMPQEKVERDAGVPKTLHKITDDQSLHTISEKESSNGETNHKKDVVVNCVISQTPMVTSQIGNDSVEKSLLTAEDKNSDNLNIKLLSNKTQEIVKSETNCENVSVEETLEEESSSLGIENQSFQDDSLKTAIEGSAALAADCDATVDFGSEDKVEWNERRNGNKEAFQSHCASVDKEGQKHAVKHIEEDVTNFKLHDNGITIEEEFVTSKKASKAVCSSVVSSDVVNATFSNDNNENLESENSTSGSGNSVDIKDKNIQTLPKTIEDAPGSVRTELNENAGDVDTEPQKTYKKKKGKKTKSKEQAEDKIKSKEKVEKKRKKEKKHVKDKTEKEVNLDSAEEKKSKLSVRSAKEQDKKSLNTCQVVTEKTLMSDSSCTEESCSTKNDNDDDDDDNWESNFDESGDCLNPDYLEELSRLTGIANPEVHKTQYDYYSFKPREIELDDEEFGHILEIYNFSPELQTQDLMQALSSFRDKGFDIKWVDDTHALAVFASRHAAQDAIQSCSGPLMKLRPVSEGITESKKKAHHCFEFLQPYRERPQTSKLLADRLVTGALGMRSKMTREERVKEREKIKEAKSKREQEKIQKAQIWGD